MKTKHRILYVEDHEDTRELVKIVLQDRDYEVVTVQTIEAALNMLREVKFDLYLLDSWLPDGSGIELCKRIRERDGYTPILFTQRRPSKPTSCRPLLPELRVVSPSQPRSRIYVSLLMH